MSFFLCLSIAMIVIAIVRVSRTSHPGGIIAWQMFWQGLEPSVALLMASITAFRSIFVSQEMRERNRKRLAAPSWRQRARQRKASDEEADLWNTSQQQEPQLPSIPQATFTKPKPKTKKNVQGHKHHSSSTAGSTAALDPEEMCFAGEREKDRVDETSLIMESSSQEDHNS